MGIFDRNSSDSIIGWNPHIGAKVSRFTYKHSRPVRRLAKAIRESPKRLRQAAKRKLITEPLARRSKRIEKQRKAIAQRTKDAMIEQGTYTQKELARNKQVHLERQGYRTEINTYLDEKGVRQYDVVSLGEPARLSRGGKKEQKVDLKEQVEEPVNKEIEEEKRESDDKQAVADVKAKQEAERRETQAIQQEALRLEREKTAREEDEKRKRVEFQVTLDEYQKRLARVTKKREELLNKRHLERREEAVKVSAPEPVTVGSEAERHDRLSRGTKRIPKKRKNKHIEGVTSIKCGSKKKRHIKRAIRRK